MEQEEIDTLRRRFLKVATTALGSVGLLTAMVPFIRSWYPNAETLAQGDPVTVDISQLQAGQLTTIEWRGKPIWIVRRSTAELTQLKKDTALLRDPDSLVDQQPPYAKNTYRSIKPEFLVLIGICTHLGCIPNYQPKPQSINKEWPGGFLCPCHGSKFDLAGRVFKGVPAPINLEVPHYTFLDEHTLLIGADKPGKKQ